MLMLVVVALVVRRIATYSSDRARVPWRIAGRHGRCDVRAREEQRRGGDVRVCMRRARWQCGGGGARDAVRSADERAEKSDREGEIEIQSNVRTCGKKMRASQNNVK